MTTTINAAATSEPLNLGQDRELVRVGVVGRLGKKS